jgi:BlaI family transcriptional regulator, penicillinase repressor
MPRIPLSKLEVEVARVLSEIGEGTLGAIHQAILATRAIEYSTLQTYIRRLEAKGYVTSSRVGRTKLYRPKIRLPHIIRDTVNDVLHRVFDGEALPFVRHLMRDLPMTADEIREIKKLISELEERTHE